MQIRAPCNICTCSELQIVNIQANTTVSSFMENSPNTQVQPSMGMIITAAFNNALCGDIEMVNNKSVLPIIIYLC